MKLAFLALLCLAACSPQGGRRPHHALDINEDVPFQPMPAPLTPARPLTSKRFLPAEVKSEDEFGEYTRARDDGQLIGAALGCNNITPGDFEYLKAGLTQALAAQEPAAQPPIIRDSFNQGARLALRGTSGPTGYGCGQNRAALRSLTREYGLQLRR